MEYTKGSWRASKSAVGDWAIFGGEESEELIAREVRHYNARLIAKSPQMAEWITKVARQGFVVFPEDKPRAKEIIQTLDLS